MIRNIRTVGNRKEIIVESSRELRNWIHELDIFQHSYRTVFNWDRAIAQGWITLPDTLSRLQAERH